MAVFIIISAIIWKTSLMKPIRTQMWQSFSPAFPCSNKEIVGRNHDQAVLVLWLDFLNTDVSIVNIVGPPGIGKSTLAIHVGNEIIANGDTVFYINMDEFPGERLKQAVSYKILSLSQNEGKSLTNAFEQLQQWAYNRWFNTILLLDNCENCIQTQKDSLYEIIQEILKYSANKIKILTTSRSSLMYVGHSYKTYRVEPLHEEAAYLLLENKVPNLLNITEKKVIADLTGEIPLALQIIGALLNFGVNPPTPSEIIAGLKKNPILTLSPDNLERNMTLNASITLSYDYLDEATQQFGQYLALFPGSFDKSALFGIMSLLPGVPRESEYYLKKTNDLIARSLLQVDTVSNRYVYHKLIKSYFIARTNTSSKNEFTVAFQHYFSHKLSEWKNIYATDPKKAILSMEFDEHNIHHLIVSLHTVTYEHCDYKFLINSFYEVFMSGLLNIKFNHSKLVEYTNDIINNMEEFFHKKNMYNDEEMPILFQQYISIIIKHCNVIANLENYQLALEKCSDRITIIEKLKEGNIRSEDYSNFYSYILIYEIYIDKKLLLLYHARLLKSIAKERLYCTVANSDTTCSYTHIASGYYSVHDYNNSIIFYEKAIANGELNTYTDIISLSRLYNMYKTRNNVTEMKRIELKLVELYNDCMSQSSSMVHSFISLYLEYLDLLKLFGESEKASNIHNKVVDSFIEFGEKVVDVKEMYYVIDTLFRLKDYKSVAKFATHGLKIAEEISVSDYITLSIWKGKAKYSVGNSTEAKHVFINQMEFLITKNITQQYSEAYYEICSYLIKLAVFDYCIDCYFQDFRDGMVKLFDALGYVVVIIPYDLVAAKASNVETGSQPLEIYPSIIEHSKDKELSIESDSQLAILPSTKWSSFSPSLTLEKFIKYGLDNLMSYNLFRFIINFFSILIRGLTIYGLFILLLKCCKLCSFCCTCCCNIIVFYYLGFLLFYLLYLEGKLHYFIESI